MVARTKGQESNCDSCINYVYDEVHDYYTCMVNLDEDEMEKFLRETFCDCPYYRKDDEYASVRRQM